MYHRSGVSSYQQVGLESSVMSATPHQLIVLLFDGARSALIRAGLFMAQGDIVHKGEAISKAINIIDNGLKAGLDAEKGDPALVANLEALYDYMCQRLLQANLHNDPAALDEVAALLSNLAEAWQQVGPYPQPSQDVN